jgi:formylglycine-generating enzyme required for sulfatase activity
MLLNIYLLIIGLLIPGIVFGSISVETRIALVIGNAAYRLTPLANTKNDACAMEKALRQCDFQVTLLLDANRSEMRRANREFGKEIMRGGVGLFYYAGHALQVKGENYLVPVGAKVEAEDEVEDECLKATSIVRKMETAKNRMNIIILDVCRSNPFRSFRSSASGLAEMNAPPRTIIQYATAKGSMASAQDEERKNGLYTSKLLDHILTPGLEVQKMFSLVREDVYKASDMQQLPWEANSMMGDFFFKPIFAEAKHIVVQPSPQLKPHTGALHVKSQPASASIYINDAYKGLSPIVLKGIVPGKIRIRASKEGYKASMQHAMIKPGEIILLSFILDQEVTTGKLYINPEDAKIRILNIQEQFNQGISLSPGQYHIEVSKTGYEKLTLWVQINAGKNTRLKIPLKEIQQIEEIQQGRSFTNSLGMKFVLISSGSFIMGDSGVQHRVSLTQNFYMQTTEVTQGQWKAVMGENPSGFYKCGDDCPVENVSWGDVEIFITRFNAISNGKQYRLPTEAEWEYAARAGTTTQFFWGNQADCSRANYGNGVYTEGCITIDCMSYNPGTTKTVMSYAPNAWGVFDMHGNVYEFCYDWHADYSTAKEVVDPSGPSSGSYRVVRGGAFNSEARHCRSAMRDGCKPEFRDRNLGFRLCTPYR